ncbi:ester cyclase [Microbulbifer sp. CnH-101-G]|uniref:ester cyclase n=1 Tax=Microbulbifer sp. CnH-101-G TaxID=3243393 RepID=UPI004039836F
MTKRYLSLVITTCIFLCASLTSVFAYSNDLEANKKLAMQAIDWWLSGTDIDPATIFAPNYVNHLDSATNYTAGPQKRNLQEVKAEVDKFHAAFKDVKILNKMQVAEGNLVATHVVIRANHVGSFMGEPPTKKTVTYDGVEFVRIKDGKITETWVTWDKYGFLKQMGAIK